jgi:hypothetical protein
MGGRGISPELVDRAFWLPNSDSDEWVTALEALDKRGDKRALLDLLRSGRDLPRDARSYLADLPERYQFKRLRPADLVKALEAVDARGDADAVVALLRAEQDLASEGRAYAAALRSERDLARDDRDRLADLIEHHEFKNKRGPPTTPAYARTEADAALELAIADVDDLRRQGKSVDDAVELVSQMHGIPYDLGKPFNPNKPKDERHILRVAYDQRRGSSNRMKRRRGKSRP